MNFEEYQKDCIQTANFDGTPCEIISNMCMGIAGEAGEVTDYLKKVLYHGHDFDSEKLTEELGDLLWYVTALASHFQIPLSYIALKNIAKLKKRYPQGKFTFEDSINRKDK